MCDERNCHIAAAESSTTKYRGLRIERPLPIGVDASEFPPRAFDAELLLVRGARGDVTRQAALDDALVRQVEATFVALLNRVYEAPAQESERIAALEAARDRLTAPRVDRS